MEIEQMTMAQLRELSRLFGNASNAAPAPDDSHWEIGKAYLIRTVTMTDLGIVVKVTPTEIVLKDAAWIANTGMFSEALRDPSKLSEVEPFPDGLVILNRSAIIDAVQYPGVQRVKK